jgi:preprotein translocase subunit YajC
MNTLLLLIGGTPDAAAPNPFVQMVPFLLILVIFYFVLIRPQQKRAQEHTKFLDQLKKGDDVITDSGLFGTVVGIDDSSVVLKVADNVRVKYLKSKVSGRQSALDAPKKK